MCINSITLISVSVFTYGFTINQWMPARLGQVNVFNANDIVWT